MRGIHQIDGLLHIVGVIDRVVTVIDLMYFWDVSGEVETSFLIFIIEADSEVDIDETTSLCFPEFILEMVMQGCMEEWSFEEFVQLMIGWLIKGNHILVLAPGRPALWVEGVSHLTF